jgi:hypothetical protein
VGKSSKDFAFNEKQDLFFSAGWTVWGAAGNWLIVFELDLGNVPRKERFIDSKRKADGQHREPKEPAGQQSLKNPHGFAGLLVIRKHIITKTLPARSALQALVGVPQRILD